VNWNPLKAVQGAASSLDQAVRDQAARRALQNTQAGDRRNRSFLYSQQPDAVAARLINDGAIPQGHAMAGMAESDLARALANRRARRAVADEVVPGMNRGPAAMTQMGVMEAINTGIATNPYVRRGVLPAAIGGGGLLAGAAITPAAQQLMALMGFMQQGQQAAEARDESPLIQQI
jgi:hypothetical protein